MHALMDGLSIALLGRNGQLTGMRCLNAVAVGPGSVRLFAEWETEVTGPGIEIFKRVAVLTSSNVKFRAL